MFWGIGVSFPVSFVTGVVGTAGSVQIVKLVLGEPAASSLLLPLLSQSQASSYASSNDSEAVGLNRARLSPSFCESTLPGMGVGSCR